MKATDDSKNPVPPDSSAAATVELIDFRPSLRKEGSDPEGPIDPFSRRARRKRRLRIAGCILLAIMAAFAAGPSVYRFAKSVRAASLARSAEADTQKGQIDDAVATVRDAYMMAPAEPEVLRAMAELLSVMDAPNAMTYWNWVLSSSIATDQDRRDGAEAALKLGYTNKAGLIIKQLLHEDPNSAPNLLMGARYYSMSHAPERAMAFANHAIQADPNYTPATIFLANQELNVAGPRQAGIDSLLKVAQGGDGFGFLAIQQLAQEPDLTPAENQSVLNDVRAYGGDNEMRKIVQLTLELKLNPSQKDALLKTAVAEHAHTSVEDISQFGGWLNSVGESKWVFSLIPQDKILNDKSLFVVYLDALAGTGKWDQMNSLLNLGRLPLETPYIELYLFRCSEELGQQQAADLHWRSAQVAASHSPRESLYLASYAEKLGENDRAEAIYQMLTHDLMAGRPAYLGLIRLCPPSDTRQLQDLLDQMATRWPDDEAVENDRVYCSLLLNSRVPEMYQRAVALTKADPYSAPHLTDVALADLRMRSPKKAVEIMEAAHIQWASAPPSTAVVYAAALEASGRGAEASQLLSSVDRKALHPQEQALIANIR